MTRSIDEPLGDEFSTAGIENFGDKIAILFNLKVFGVLFSYLYNCAACHQAKTTPYMYTQFCEK